MYLKRIYDKRHNPIFYSASGYVCAPVSTDHHIVPAQFRRSKVKNGCDLLALCRQNNCEVVQAPTNTSHFLQPCDQVVDKAFKGAVKDMTDEVTSMAIANKKAVQFKLMCGVFGFH